MNRPPTTGEGELTAPDPFSSPITRQDVIS